jgi:hypothetical protein
MEKSLRKEMYILIAGMVIIFMLDYAAFRFILDVDYPWRSWSIFAKELFSVSILSLLLAVPISFLILRIIAYFVKDIKDKEEKLEKSFSVIYWIVVMGISTIYMTCNLLKIFYLFTQKNLDAIGFLQNFVFQIFIAIILVFGLSHCMLARAKAKLK